MVSKLTHNKSVKIRNSFVAKTGFETSTLKKKHAVMISQFRITLKQIYEKIKELKHLTLNINFLK
jgi:hypothetical protein